MEAAFRLAAFAAVFALLALWEVVGHRRALAQARDRRWATNLGLLLIDILVQRITLGAIAFTAAIVARDNGIGLFNRLDWPPWLAWLLAFVALDLAVWLQHVVTHRVPILWRLHRSTTRISMSTSPPGSGSTRSRSSCRLCGRRPSSWRWARTPMSCLRSRRC